MKNHPKPIRAWICTWHMTSCEPYFMLETAAETRNASTAKFLAGRGVRSNVPWREFYKDGARCVRVTIKPVP